MMQHLFLVIAFAAGAAFGVAPWPEVIDSPAGIAAPALDADGPPLADPPDAERTVPALVLTVQDGDSVTLMLDGEMRRFELLGADAPEWLDRAETQRPHAAESRRFLTNLLLGERVLVFEPEPGATDALGRRRGYLFRQPDGMFVDLEIIRQGYGKVSTRAAEPYEPVLRWYERRARELDRGVWGGPPEPEPAVEDPEAPAQPAPAADRAPPRPEPKPQPEPASEDGFVWITRSGSKYHREGCSHLTTSRTRVPRDSIRSTHEPCKTCSPDS
tara:strand:- start:6161 stop:6976 length:816 start_codon:yes stop_codon:yes gene_type:complete